MCRTHATQFSSSQSQLADSTCPCPVQRAASRTRKETSKLRGHLETLLLSNYGLRWNMAKDLAPGAVYSAINTAYRQHLDSIIDMDDAKQPARMDPLQRAASLLRGVLEEGNGREGSSGGQGQFAYA